MTGFRVDPIPFDNDSFAVWGEVEPLGSNWPVVYTLTGGREVYVGETLNMIDRARQHRVTPEKQNLDKAYVVIDETFNKSACLDLESSLIQWFSGDGAVVRNLNAGVLDRDYFDRRKYQAKFREIFEELRARGLFERSIPQIENTALFKLSPFKALAHGQAIAVDGLLKALFADLRGADCTTSVVRGEPGTGKTIVAIYLIKLLRDIAHGLEYDDRDKDMMFAEYFDDEHRALLENARIGFVIPQQSLRTSVKRVFTKTPGLDKSMVLSPFQAGRSPEKFDILIVDEAHRLNLRANQPSAAQNKLFREINERLFGEDDTSKTQLDWIKDRSSHQILMLDTGQSVRPSDLSAGQTNQLLDTAERADRLHVLESQMRLQDAAGFVQYVRDVFGMNTHPQQFDRYDLRFFETLTELREEINAREDEQALSRLVAGYAWPWRSKKDKTAFDIEHEGLQLRWNQTEVDWINSASSKDEVGSIHTVQGYDLNYAGVIIGPELGFDPETKQITFHRKNYHDKKGIENNPTLGKTYTDDDLLKYVINIYVVLMTRGMIGTYVYVVDPDLRAYLRPYFSASDNRGSQRAIDVRVTDNRITIDPAAIERSTTGASQQTPNS